MNFDLPELDPYGQLWIAVLAHAVEDLTSTAQSLDTERRMARRWFQSKRTGVGSFLWICVMFNFDPEAILERVRQLLEQRPRPTDVESPVQGDNG